MTQTDRRTVLQAAAGLVTAAAFTAACTTTGAAAHPTAPKPPTARTPRRIPGHPTHLTHGPGTAPRVALTFHGNGDPATAEAVLEESERHGAHITVLAVGTWLDANPGLARRILDAGHDLGNHTQHHLDINAMQEARARAEITDCAERLRRLTGSIGTWFRPSRAARASPWSPVWPATPATRRSSPTTSTPSTSPGPAPPPSARPSPPRSAPARS